MPVAEDSVLQFLDLSFHVNERKKIYVDVYAKPTFYVYASFNMLS